LVMALLVTFVLYRQSYVLICEWSHPYWEHNKFLREGEDPSELIPDIALYRTPPKLVRRFEMSKADYRARKFPKL
jgi:hypothetical protein